MDMKPIFIYKKPAFIVVTIRTFKIVSGQPE
jgi:hypothetical protein